MCGRFTLSATLTTLTKTFPEFELPDQIIPRYNITPTQEVAVVANDKNTKIQFFRWGLIPSWAKDPTIGNRMINSRSETLAEKPSFRTAYRRWRCLVLADGYYEWRKEPGGGAKTPFYIRMASEKPFAFAGLWEQWQPSRDADTVLSCTILTCPPNEILERVHNRMPVILDYDAYDLWLEPTNQKPAELNHLLKPYPADEMTAHAVSRLVNQPKNDRAECILPV